MKNRKSSQLTCRQCKAQRKAQCKAQRKAQRKAGLFMLRCDNGKEGAQKLLLLHRLQWTISVSKLPIYMYPPRIYFLDEDSYSYFSFLRLVQHPFQVLS